MSDYRVFATISPKLLRLRSNISEQVETFVNNNFSDYNIGVHLRTKKQVGDLITPIEHFCQAVRMLMLGKGEKKLSIFLAADTNKARDDLAGCLRNSLGSSDNNLV